MENEFEVIFPETDALCHCGEEAVALIRGHGICIQICDDCFDQLVVAMEEY